MTMNAETLYQKGGLERRKCIECKKFFYVRKDRRISQHSIIGIRQRNQRTCSEECSKIRHDQMVYENGVRYRKEKCNKLRKKNRKDPYVNGRQPA